MYNNKLKKRVKNIQRTILKLYTIFKKKQIIRICIINCPTYTIQFTLHPRHCYFVVHDKFQFSLSVPAGARAPCYHRKFALKAPLISYLIKINIQFIKEQKVKNNLIKILSLHRYHIFFNVKINSYYTCF